MACQAAWASGSRRSARIAATSGNADRSTQWETSVMVRLVLAAANSSGASSLVARVSQNLALSWRSSTEAASASQVAVRVASGKVVEESRGDHLTVPMPVALVGSNRTASPNALRRWMVRS